MCSLFGLVHSILLVRCVGGRSRPYAGCWLRPRPSSAVRPALVQPPFPPRGQGWDPPHNCTRGEEGLDRDQGSTRIFSGLALTARSGADEIHRTEKVHLPDIDAVMAEDGVSHRQVEEDVPDRHVTQINT